MSLGQSRSFVSDGAGIGLSPSLRPTPDLVIIANAGEPIDIPDPAILLKGEYQRDGSDLWLDHICD